MSSLMHIPRLSRGVFRQQMDRIFDDLFPALEGEVDTVWAPRMDVSEDDDHYAVVMDLPGIAKKDLSIEFQDGRLSIRGERKLEKKGEKRNYQRMERTYGSFYRSLALPESVKADEVDASFKDGVLTLLIPKAEQTRPQRIEIH